MTRVVPDVTIATPKIVALTNGQRLSSNLESVNSLVTHKSTHTIIKETFPTSMIIMPELLSSEGHKCSSSLDYYTTYPHTWKFTSTDTTLLEYWESR